MNYYRRYSGDYLRDTARLTLTEHGAYNLLMDYYYSEEEPLSLDHQELYLMLRAMRPEDRKAVDKVLGMFFTSEPDGYHQKRVDHEISVSKKARDNGKGGGRPATKEITGSITGLETEQETGLITGSCESGYLNGADLLTGSGHPPTTNHQPPASSLQPKSRTPSAPKEKISLSPDGVWVGIRAAQIELWKQAYPAVLLEAELHAAAAWIMANPANKKTNYPRYITNWLKKQQDKAPRSAQKTQSSQREIVI